MNGLNFVAGGAAGSFNPGVTGTSSRDRKDRGGSARHRGPRTKRVAEAAVMFLNTGQRRSNVVRMAWSHITPENKITLVQQKTGRRLHDRFEGQSGLDMLNSKLSGCGPQAVIAGGLKSRGAAVSCGA
jgi:hypothetical protein